GRLGDNTESERDVGRPLERLGIHLAERRPASGRPPDQLGDLPEHPSLVLAVKRRTLVQEEIDALLGGLAAKFPASKGSAKKSSADLLVLRVAEPFTRREDAILQHRRALGVEVDDDEVLGFYAGVQHLVVLVVSHGRRGIDLLVE